MSTQRLPIKTIIETLDKMVKDSGLSYREIQRRANALGYNFTLYSILAVAKADNANNIGVLDTADKYIEAVLDVLECSPKDFVLMMGEYVQTKRVIKKDKQWWSPDVREFMENPEARPYIELAYMNYQKDKLEEKSRKIKEQLNNKKK